MGTPRYGMTRHCDLFTNRQLVALNTFSDLVSEVRDKIKQDAIATGIADDGLSLSEGGTSATAYGDAVATYLAFAVDKIADRNSTIATWAANREHARNTFTRQSISMTWDFAESNTFSNSSGNFFGGIKTIYDILETLYPVVNGQVRQHNAISEINKLNPLILSTDPPYYDAIPYADLSDFFYVWLRHSLSSIYPELFTTLLVPKEKELVADQYRHGSREKAKIFFEEGLKKVFSQVHKSAKYGFPFIIYYAFKQTESEVGNETNNQINIASTGWETMLEGLIKAGFSITGTLPMRTELERRMRGQKSNALASSIVLICRTRPDDAPSATRRQFLKQLQTEFPTDLKNLQQGNIAPVDLAQASIGLGMSVFSRYSKVLEADGSPMRVRTALQIINSYIDEFLNEQEGEFDPDTRWALTWFEQYQFEAGQYGDAETLSKAKNTSIKGLEDAGILIAKNGKVRLLKREELPKTWNPAKDDRTPDWEATQHLIQTLDKQGETGAAKLLAQLADKGEICRDLAYRLYVICDRQGWTQEAISYNSLVTSWSEITRLAAMEQQPEKMVQGKLAVH
jgi:putative DNA methylase